MGLAVGFFGLITTSLGLFSRRCAPLPIPQSLDSMAAAAALSGPGSLLRQVAQLQSLRLRLDLQCALPLAGLPAVLLLAAGRKAAAVLLDQLIQQADDGLIKSTDTRTNLPGQPANRAIVSAQVHAPHPPLSIDAHGINHLDHQSRVLACSFGCGGSVAIASINAVYSAPNSFAMDPLWCF